MNMAMNPSEVAIMAKSTAGPDRVRVVFTASAREVFFTSSSNRYWNWIA